MFLSEGKITIKAIHGAHGRFCVGELTIPEGFLKVKDSLLDQFEPGTYSGKFDIGGIGVQSYAHSGRVVTELRARLNAMYIDEVGDDDAGEGHATPPQSEPDPAAEEDAPPQPGTVCVEAPPADPVPGASESSAVAEDGAGAMIETEFMNETERAQLATLGQEIYAQVLARAAVKLDPTVGRVHLREQAAMLKALGYRFDGKSQTWHAASA